MSVFLCPGCNELFLSAETSCPRCGMTGMAPPESLLPEADTGIQGSATDFNADQVEIAVDNMLLEGQQLHIYECQRILGHGGMGIVYLAHNGALHRHCALKVLSPRRISADVDYVERFAHEARAAAALVHPHVVTTHAVGVQDGHHYLEMEYVAGRSLQQEIDESGAIGPLRATEMATGIASGLAAAHRLGIVHRDLKPDNILVTPAGRPKIGDFGLAKRVQTNLTRPGQLAGTPNFMAPEIFDGNPATPSSDVFALGVCYYLMLTGRLPFESESLSGLMNTVLTGEYTPVRELNPAIPLDMAECVALMLARSPKNRPVDGNAVSQLLQAVLGSARDLDTLVYDAFANFPIAECRPFGAGFEIRLQLPHGRGQSVFVENSEHSAGDRLLLIYSVCCDAKPTFYEQALRLNAEVQHGSLSIRDIDGRTCFVMVDTYPRATVDVEEIRRSVVEVGTQADKIECLLTRRDEN